MPRYTVSLTTYANTVVDVDAPDDATPEEIAELAIEQNQGPTLCHHCTGGTRDGRQYLEIGDDWEPATFDGQPLVTRID